MVYLLKQLVIQSKSPSIQWLFSGRDKGGNVPLEINKEKEIVFILHLFYIIYISSINLNDIRNYSLLIINYGNVQCKYKCIVKKEYF